MNTVLILVVVLYHGTFICCDPYFRPDYKFVPNLEGWTKFHRYPLPHGEARFRCQIEGALLMSPLNDQLYYEMVKVANSIRNVGKIHTGISSNGGDFVSAEGVLLSKLPYRFDSSSGPGSKDCVILLGAGLLKFEYKEAALPYLCYKKKTTDYYKTNCGTYDTDYRLNMVTGKCYKFHTNSLTWSRALITCKAEGGYLPVIQNQYEAKILLDLYNTIPLQSISTIYKYSLFLGASKINEIWTMIDGRELASLGFKLWAPGQPNNLTNQNHPEGQSCLALATQFAALDDLWCSEPLSFICEKDPMNEPSLLNDRLYEGYDGHNQETNKVKINEEYDGHNQETNKVIINEEYYADRSPEPKKQKSKPKKFVTRRIITRVIRN